MQSDKRAYISHSIGRVSLLKYVILLGVVAMALQCAAPTCIYYTKNMMLLLDNQEPCERYYESCCFPSMQKVPQSLMSLKVPLDQDTSNINLSWADSQTCEENWRRVAFASETNPQQFYSRTLICKTHRSRFWIDHVTLSHIVLTWEGGTQKVYI